VIAGLVLSFSLLILVGSEVLSLLHLPQDSLRDAGLALLLLRASPGVQAYDFTFG
jgi:hypothetical protein